MGRKHGHAKPIKALEASSWKQKSSAKNNNIRPIGESYNNSDEFDPRINVVLSEPKFHGMDAQHLDPHIPGQNTGKWWVLQHMVKVNALA